MGAVQEAPAVAPIEVSQAVDANVDTETTDVSGCTIGVTSLPKSPARLQAQWARAQREAEIAEMTRSVMGPPPRKVPGEALRAALSQSAGTSKDD